MKAIKCELCGSNELIKDEGYFVCKYCKTRYTLEESRKLFVEVTGTVQIDRSNDVEKLMKNARQAYSDKHYEEALTLYSNVTYVDLDNTEAILFKGLSLSWSGTIESPKHREVYNAYTRAVTLLHEQVGDAKEFFDFVTNAQLAARSALSNICDMFVNGYCQMSKAPALSLSVGALDRMYATMQDTLKGLASMVLSMAKTAFELVGDFSQADDEYFEAQKLFLGAAKDFLIKANLLPHFEKKERDALLQRIQTVRQEKYWADHPDEHRIHLEKQERIKPLMDRKAALEEIHNALGVFSIKEKKALSNRIALIEEAIARINNE
ncbi:MAG: TFIIB-type zinc finger domain-containing protein [Coriobacteriia bacterium]|nr:TFIIB-type zinc finger domain-containing protein [Coriobacteriia bacterium]